MSQSDMGDVPPAVDVSEGPSVESEIVPPRDAASTRVAVEGSLEQPPIKLRLDRAHVARTADEAFWAVIRSVSDNILFDEYEAFLDPIMCGQLTPALEMRKNSLPFPGVGAYALLKAATEVFLLSKSGLTSETADQQWAEIEVDRGERQRHAYAVRVKELRFEWEKNYLREGPRGLELPYISVIRLKLGLPVVGDDQLGIQCHGLLQSKVNNPLMIELIWSYWLEEGMLAQTMNAISMRFQNRRRPGPRDPLLRLNVDPLRPLGSLLWGYVQDEQHRLTVTRRAAEYAHQYGLTMEGKAVRGIDPADRRTKFLQAFHTLLYECARFFAVDDDTTRSADAFPILKHLKILDRFVSETSHNQYGELGSTARIEMMMMQWLLARPESREYLGARGMIAYPEPWMEQVEAMKNLQRWVDTDITYFRDLAIFGERLVLTFRFGDWTPIIYPQNAANWARYWRPEIQGYIDSYEVVTGVNLAEPPPKDPQALALRFAPPAVHLARRYAEQQGSR
jgi:hypothetical protein